MNIDLTEDQRLLLDSIKAFVEQEFMPYEDAVDKAANVDDDLAEQIKKRAIEMGFYAANLPESVGGGGLNHVERTILEREFGKVTHALHEIAARPTELLMACQGDQIETYLKPSVTGERAECFGLTEPGAGSDVMGMQTRARQDGDDWIITGQKHFISSAVNPDFAIVFAATGVEQTPRGERKQVTSFLVDVGTKGFEMVRGPQPVSQRAYRNFELYFDDCRVPASQILGEPGTGLDLANQWLRAGRIWVAAGCCGKLERLLELSTEWAATRQQFGQPIGKFQGTSFKLADMATELLASDLLTFHAARGADADNMRPDDVAMAKLYASEALGRGADNAVQIFGGMGLMEALPIERLWRDARLERIWEGTSEIQRHIISRTLLREHGA